MEFSKTFQQIKLYANSRGLPLIPLCAKNVTLMSEPNIFYQLLINKLRNARRRIALSALYLGSGDKEKALVRTICDNLDHNRNLNVNISLDFNRARRIDKYGISSVSILQDVLAYNSVCLNLVKSNSSTGIIHEILSSFDRWNELSSTYHSKFLLFDDDIIITGANLSSIYFEKRQDRYMLIKNIKSLSDYLSDLTDEFASSNVDFPRVIKNLNRKYIDRIVNSEIDPGTDSYIMPLCQHGPSGLNTSDEFLSFLERILPQNSQIHLSSGYFNPKTSFKPDSVMVPAEEANGFFDGPGLLKYIPRIYTALMKSFTETNPNCAINLYRRTGWSYHAKGIWFDIMDDITIHMIGSSNFNWRSSTRDFEVQFLIVTTNKDLKEALCLERLRLLEHTTPLNKKDMDVSNHIYSLFANFIKSLL